VAEGFHYANGVAVSADGKTLFASEHLERRVLAFDIAADGSLANRRVFVRLDDVEGSDPSRGWELGPDGLATDSAGRVYVAEYGAGHFLVVDRDGRLLTTITVPERYTTAVALSDDEKTLYVTAPDSLYPTRSGAVYALPNPVGAGD
jgi:gluconolactonase